MSKIIDAAGAGVGFFCSKWFAQVASEYPSFSVVNPALSGKTILIHQLTFAPTADGFVYLYKNDNGEPSETIYNTHIGGGEASVAEIHAGTRANTTGLNSRAGKFCNAQEEVDFCADGGVILVAPGSAITIQGYEVNRSGFMEAHWLEL